MHNLKKPEQQVLDHNVLEGVLKNGIFPKQNDFRNICQLFEAQAQKSPDSVAVIFEQRKLSYFDLNKKSDQLASYLRYQGVKPGIVVGLSLPKNENLIIGILGILKAGGIYFPLDVDYPQERLKYMMGDARPSLLLTQSDLAHKLPLDFCPTVFIDRNWDKNELPDLISDKDIQPESPAYIVYTSGSTGTPKGIVVAHKSLPNVVESRFDIYPKKPVALLVGSISFDPTLLTILYVLVSGGSLCIPASEAYSDLKEIIDLINKNSVNFILCVTSFYSMLLKNAKRLTSLEYVFIGGEAMPSSLPSLHSRIAPHAYLFNEYGPAEHAIGGTISKIYDPKQKRLFPNTIGKPWSYVQVYILNEDLKPVRKNSEGEIYIGGIGLAKGYQNRQELTDQKFLWVPLKDQKPIRLYRTGDWGRFLPNGDIEYLGRIDHQVKIWGHRVELEEIESVLTKFRLVNEAIVVQDKENEHLIAFYTTNTARDIKEALHSHLSRFLPDYMIPSIFYKIDRWPTTPNGKIDRASLLSFLENSAHKSTQPFLSLSQIKKELQKIWKTVLQKTDFGLHDNFFDLGGDSIQVSNMQALIENKFDLDMNIVELFQFPTISQLAHCLQAKVKQLVEKV